VLGGKRAQSLAAKMIPGAGGRGGLPPLPAFVALAVFSLIAFRDARADTPRMPERKADPRAVERPAGLGLPASTTPNGPRYHYDVEHYALDLTVLPDSAEIKGTVAIAFKALVGLDTVVLDAGPTVHISGAWSHSGSAGVTAVGSEQVSVHLARALAAGER